MENTEQVTAPFLKEAWDPDVTDKFVRETFGPGAALEDFGYGSSWAKYITELAIGIAVLPRRFAEASGHLHAALAVLGGVAHRHDAWIARDALRMQAGEWKVVKAEGKVRDLPGHFLHVSEKDPKLVAYTPSRQHGIEDRQVRLTLGKYLNRFKEELGLSDSEINEVVRQWNIRHTPAKLHITSDADEIVFIYKHGPDSCMVPHKVPHEPVRAYAGPDTAVAALYQGEFSEGHILARTVINKKTNGWIRIFSNDDEASDALEAQLTAEGYSENEDLKGVRLRLIEEGVRVMCPYIDGTPDRGDLDYVNGHIIIRSNGDYDLRNAGGWLEELEGETCDVCGDRTDEDDLTYVESDERSVCEHCLRNRYTYAYTGRYQEYVRDHEVYGSCDGDAYTSEGASYHDLAFAEDDSDTLRPIDEMVYVGESGEYYTDEDAARAAGYVLAEDDEWVSETNSGYVRSLDGKLWRPADALYYSVRSENTQAEDGEWVPDDDPAAHGYYEILDRNGCAILCHEESLHDYGYELRDGEPELIQPELIEPVPAELLQAAETQEAVAYG